MLCQRVIDEDGMCIFDQIVFSLFDFVVVCGNMVLGAKLVLFVSTLSDRGTGILAQLLDFSVVHV